MTSNDLLLELDDLGTELRSLVVKANAGNARPCGSSSIRPVQLDRQVAQRIAHALAAATDALQPPEQPANQASVTEDLSARQREILSWVALGKSNSIIASILGISPHTVDTHMRRIFERLGTTDRTVAAIRAVQSGMIAPSGLQAA